jgi:predicted NACHT family NTPase
MEKANTEFDINKFAAEYVDKNIERIYNTGHNFIKGTKNAIKAKLKRTYQDYILNISKKYAKTKSFFIRDKQVFLETFYIPLSLSLNKNKIGKASVNKLSEIGKYSVIQGTAGCGKSILMKYLLIDTLKNTEFVPVFIELREINKIDGDLFNLITSTLSDHKLNLDSDYFTKAFEDGQFIFFFDGFDEVVNNKRDIVRKNINEIIQTYSKSNILVSSRPESEFNGWKEFSVFNVNNLEVEEACQLISNLPYDDDIKNKFITDLRNGLFNKHESFLSNPLLLSIMLLTYGQSANIPNKLSVFYNQAYEALFQRHDTYKAGFMRERLLKIDIQDFCKIISAFSIQTYDKREFQFSRIDVLKYLDTAKKIIGLEFNSEHFLIDSLKSSCLLIEDGLFITFSHRSFQEYFAARFIDNIDINTKKALITKYSHNIRRDEVFKLLLEMNEESMESLFIIPNLQALFEKIGIKENIEIINFYNLLNLCFTEIFYEDESLKLTFNNNSESIFISDLNFFTIHNFSKLITWKGFNYSNKEKHKYDKYWLNNMSYNYKLIDLTIESELIIEMYNDESYYSRKSLEVLFDIYNAILKKHSNSSKSIEEILLKQ